MDKTNPLWYKFNHFIEDVVVENSCNANSISIDVGCHAGRFTWRMAKLSHTVFAFDPSPILLFRKNRWPELPYTNPEGVGNVAFINCGVGDKHHILTYTEYNDPTWNSLYHGEFIRGKDLVKVSEKKVVVVCLDDTVNGNVSYIKIDAEGGDLKVLQGAKRLIQSSLPVITVESGGPLSRRKIMDFLTELGYNVWNLGSELKEPSTDHTIVSLNLLAIHKTDYRRDKIIADINSFVTECQDKPHSYMQEWIVNYTSK